MLFRLRLAILVQRYQHHFTHRAGTAGGLTYEVTPEVIDAAYTAARADQTAKHVPRDTPRTIGVNKTQVPTTELIALIFRQGGWAQVCQCGDAAVPRLRIVLVSMKPERYTVPAREQHMSRSQLDTFCVVISVLAAT